MNQNNNSIDDDKALTAISGVAESVVAETTVESNTGISTTTMDVDDASSPPVDDMVTVPVEATAMTVIVAENINIGTNIEKSPEEEAMHETMIETTTTTIAPKGDTVGEEIAVTATNVQTTNDDIDDAMVESESNAISLASTALLIDLERRYMDMSTDYQRLKVELHHAQSQIQQQQQLSSTTEPNVTLQNSLNAKEEQIVQLQNQIQTQQETFRLVQEQKDQLQANHDTLQEDMRYGH